MAATTARTPGNGTGTLSYTLPGEGFDVESVYVSIDNTAGASAVTAELTIADQSGVVIARKAQGTPVAAGATGSATWALRLDDEAAASSAYTTVQDEGVALTQRSVLDFVGAGATATDDPGGLRTLVTIPGGGIGLAATGIFGDGSTGAVTLTQASAAPAWATKTGVGASTVFTLGRDIWATTVDFDDSAGAFTVACSGCRIFATTSITIDAGVLVHNNGPSATNQTAGGNPISASIGSPGTGNGTGGTNGVGTTPTLITNSAALGSTFDASTAVSVTVVQGGTGGAAAGGPGTGGGTAGGSIDLNTNAGIPRDLPRLLTGFTHYVIATNLSKYAGGAGGAAGNGGGGVILGGAGGSGGGVLGIYAPVLVNNGAIRCNGGTGGAATGAGNAGGGGGGGGGAVFLVYGSSGSTVGTVTVAGGTGGAPVGAGKTGGTGVVGAIYQMVL